MSKEKTTAITVYDSDSNKELRKALENLEELKEILE